MRSLHKIQSTIVTKFRVTDSIQNPETGEVMPCITGRASHVDVISQKGYRYPKGFWDKVINDDELQTRIENRDVLGMIEHPTDDMDFMCTPYDKAAVVCLKAWVEDYEPFITLGILNNPNGSYVKSLVEVGHRPGCSTRAFGDYGDDAKGKFVVEDGFYCVGWDIVRAPNFEDIRMDKVSDSLENSPVFRELMQMTQLRDSVTEDFNRDVLRGQIAKAIEALREVEKNL